MTQRTLNIRRILCCYSILYDRPCNVMWEGCKNLRAVRYAAPGIFPLIETVETILWSACSQPALVEFFHPKLRLSSWQKCWSAQPPAARSLWEGSVKHRAPLNFRPRDFRYLCIFAFPSSIIRIDSGPTVLNICYVHVYLLVYMFFIQIYEGRLNRELHFTNCFAACNFTI